jgi:hypothetical protein
MLHVPETKVSSEEWVLDAEASTPRLQKMRDDGICDPLQFQL